MTTIKKNEFVNQFSGGDGFDLNKMSEEAKTALVNAGVDLTKIDSNNDGKIKGKKELEKLFNVVDSFDMSSSPSSFDTTDKANFPTYTGAVYDALVAEFNRNANNAKLTGPQPKPVNDPSSLPNTFDKDFFVKLSNVSDGELRQWYHQQARQNPKFGNNIRESYVEVFKKAQLNDSERSSLDKLGDRLQNLQSERSGAWAMEKYGKQSQDEIAKGFIDRIQNAEQKNGADGRQAEINKIMEDMKLLAASPERLKSGKAYNKTMEALQQAMQHQYPNQYAKGGKIETMPRADVIEAAERLQGPGSAAVKADLIKTMLTNRPSAEQMSDLTEHFKGGLPKEMVKVIAENSMDKDKADDLLKKLEMLEKVPGQAKKAMEKMKSLTSKIVDEKYPGAAIETLMKSDPGGIADEFEYLARDHKNPHKDLLDRSLDAVYRAHRKDPQRAADLVGEMLGSAAEDLAKVTEKKPFDENQLREIKDHGHRVGFLLQSAKNMVKTMSEDKKKAIDEGAFIAGIFSKAFSKIPGAKEVSKEVIDDLKNKEYKQVQDWQTGVEKGYFRLLETAFYEGNPDSRSGSETTEFKKDLESIYDEVRNGMQSHDELQAR